VWPRPHSLFAKRQNAIRLEAVGAEALKMEIVCFSETLVSTYEPVRRCNSEQ
jgi:hypothetical protein